MPYIKKDHRKLYDSEIKKIVKSIVSWEQDNNEPAVGQMNYVVSKMIQIYLTSVEEKYHNYNAMIGMLECAKLELYRDKVAPYEIKAKKKNGKL